MVTSTRLPLCFATSASQPAQHAAFRARRLGIEHIGRIADQRQHAVIADRGQFLHARRYADLRLVVELPVAGVENIAIGRVDQQRVALGNRMGERDIADAEGAERETVEMIDDVEFDLVGNSRLIELVLHQSRGERRRIERHAEVGGEIGHCADVVLMGMGQHHADQILAPLLDEFEIGEDQIDPGIFVAAEGHAEIDHQPFAVAAIEIDVHANLARTAERKEQQFLAGFHTL